VEPAGDEDDVPTYVGNEVEIRTAAFDHRTSGHIASRSLSLSLSRGLPGPRLIS
jgi:hypothetical protein